MILSIEIISKKKDLFDFEKSKIITNKVKQKDKE